MATVEPFDRELHAEESVSRQVRCGQGGRDTCSADPVFSVVGDYRVAARDEHLAGAVRQAIGLPARS